MKKPAVSIVLLFLLLLLGGCSAREGTAVTETSSDEPARDYIYGIPVLTDVELTRQVLSLAEAEPLEIGVSLFYDNAEIPCLSDGKTYYLTVDEDYSGWGAGEMTATFGYSLAFAEADVKTPLSERMKKGESCAVYAYNGVSYAKLELIFTTLPVITLDNGGTEINRGERNCDFTLFQPRAGKTAAVQLSSPATIRVRGATSAQLSKTGYALELYKEGYEDTQKLSLLGMRKDDDWILYPAHSDETKIRDAVSWYLWEKIGAYAAGDGAGTIQLRYTEVLLNGEYFGLYILMERMDEKTLDLDDDDTLFKATSWDVPSSASMRAQKPNSPICGGLEKKFPDPMDKVDGSWDVMADFVELTYESEGKAFAASIDECVDVQNMLDYWLFVNLIMGDDNRYKNTYYATIDGKVHAFPWDLDISFGLAWGADKPNYLYRYPNYATAIFDFSCGRRLIKYYPGAAEYIKSRWEELTSSGVATYDGIMAVAESYWNELHDSGAFERNKERWQDGNYADDLDYFSTTVGRRLTYLGNYIKGL